MYQDQTVDRLPAPGAKAEKAAVDVGVLGPEVMAPVPERPRVGRPPHFSSVVDMQAKIKKYFAEADEKKWPYTIPELALALGFTSRQSLLNYQSKPEYMDAIKRAKLRIEGQRARQLVQGQGIVAGQIFDLKNNFGWKDQVEQVITGEDGGPITHTVGLVGMPPAPKNMDEWERWYWQQTKGG